MRIASGTTDQYVYFLATLAGTPVTGLATWTVYRSRNGAAAAAMTTPTISETSSGSMPGVYELLLDEDMTIAAGNSTEAMVFYITEADCDPITIQVELFRPTVTEGNTLGVASDGDISGNLDGTVATVTTLTGHTAQTGDTYALANGATGFVAIDTVVDGIQTDLDNGTDGLGAIKTAVDAIPTSNPTANAIADQVWDELQSAHVTVGSFGEMATEIASILTDTNELQTDDVPGLIAALNDVAATDIVSGGAITTSGGAVSNVTLVATTTTNTDMRGTDSAYTGTPPTANAIADQVWDEVASGHNTSGTFGKFVRQTKEGVISEESTVNDAGATTTVFITALTEATDDHYNDSSIVFIDGNLKGQTKTIADYTGSSKTITLDEPLTEAPANGDGFLLLTGHVHAVSQIVDSVWDEDIIAAHTTTDSAGLILANTRKLATGAGGISATMTSHTATDVGTETNTEASTASLDGIYHICPPGTNLDMYYEFDVGVTGVATECIWDGYVTSNNDQCEVYGYDWIAAGWVQVGVIAGTAGTTDQEQVFILDNTMTGTGANTGKVRVRFDSDGVDVVTAVATDRILIEYTALPGAGFDLHDGVAQAGTSNTITLDTGANATDDFYNHARIVITGGTGQEQERIIVDYAGSTKVATIAPPWVTTPDTTSVFIIEPATVHSETDMNTLKVGLTAAATSTSITLDTTASAVDDYYNNDVVVIDAGTGAGQERVITDYDGTTKIATVDPAWTTTPDTTSEYVVEASHPYINTDLAVIDANVDAILVDTGTTIPAQITTAQNDLDIITGATGVNLLTATQASIDAIEADTNELQTDDVPGLIATLDAVVDTVKAETVLILADTNAILVDTATTIPGTLTTIEGKIDTVDTVVDAILVDTGTDIPATLAGTLTADMVSISGSTTAADKLEASALQIIIGAAEAGTLSTTVMTSDLAEATDDHYNGRVIIWTSGVLIGQASNITDYAGATGELTFTATTEAPTAGDTFVIV